MSCVGGLQFLAVGFQTVQGVNRGTKQVQPHGLPHQTQAKFHQVHATEGHNFDTWRGQLPNSGKLTHKDPGFGLNTCQARHVPSIKGDT